MPQRKNPPQLSEGEKPATRSTELSRLKACLTTASAFFKTTLTEGEGRIWKEVLNRASISEIEEAFSAWHFKRWGDEYPKMPTPGSIMESVEARREEKRLEEASSSRIPAERYGNGYGWNDVLWLHRRRMAESKPGVHWSISDWEELFAELDRKREGGSPEWRKTAEGQSFLRA